MKSTFDLDSIGCGWGRQEVGILKQRFEDHCDKQMSDIADAMQVSRSSLQILQEDRKTTKEDNYRLLKDLEIKFAEVHKKVDSLWIKVLIASLAGNGILFGVLLTIMLNHFNHHN